MLHTDEDVDTLIEDYGLDAVVVTLMEMAATASSKDLPKLLGLLDTAFAINGGKQ